MSRRMTRCTVCGNKFPVFGDLPEEDRPEPVCWVCWWRQEQEREERLREIAQDDEPDEDDECDELLGSDPYDYEGGEDAWR
jgi:hypothetical protein